MRSLPSRSRRERIAQPYPRRPTTPVSRSQLFGPKEEHILMRHSLPLSLAGLAALLTFAVTGAAFAREARQPDRPAPVIAMRSLVDHYRTLTWNYERAGRAKRAPTSSSSRRSGDRAYLEWSSDTWPKRAYLARQQALARIHRKLAVALPKPPSLHAQL